MEDDGNANFMARLMDDSEYEDYLETLAPKTPNISTGYGYDASERKLLTDILKRKSMCEVPNGPVLSHETSTPPTPSSEETPCVDSSTPPIPEELPEGTATLTKKKSAEKMVRSNLVARTRMLSFEATQRANGGKELSPLPPTLKEMATVPKSAEVKKFLCDALSVHFLFSTLKDSCISEMVSTMRMHTHQRNTRILIPSPTMRALFVIERGTVEMKKGDDDDDDDAATLGVGHVLGDDHFLYANGTSDIMQHYIARSETVILWSLRYDVFRECKRAEFRNSKKVLEQLLLKVARQLGGDADVVPSYMYDDFMPQTFPAGATVIRQGEEGSCCYILASGTVDVFVDSKRVRTLQEGSYFGHRALRSESAVRTATCVARSKIHCFTLDRLTFASLVRRKKERVTAAIERGQRSSHPKAPDLPSYAERVIMPSFPLGKAEIVRTRRDVSEEAKSKACTPIPTLKYSSFRVVRAIGKGAFGKVVLAKYDASRELYAIKRVDTSAAREMRVMSGLCHPNIAHVVAQVKTRMGLFLVLPFFGGGDLFSALDRQKKRALLTFSSLPNRCVTPQRRGAHACEPDHSSRHQT